MRDNGRPRGDVACEVCQRPLMLPMSWKLRLPNGRTRHYCAEHVVITDRGQRWRPRTKDDPDDLPAMGDKVKVAEPNAEPSPAWDDNEPPVLNAPRPPVDEPYDVVERPSTFPGGFHSVPPKTWPDVAGEIVENIREKTAPADDDFDPLNDVGF